MKSAATLLLAQAFTGTTQAEFINELVYLEGHKTHEDYSSPLPHTWEGCPDYFVPQIITTPYDAIPLCPLLYFSYISAEDLPEEFSWNNVNGKSYLTHLLNQHIPQ